MNIPFVDDFNAQEFNTPGVGFNQNNIHEGSRHSVSDAYLHRKVLERSNLYIKLHAHVEKLNFEGNQVKSVTVVIDGVRKTISANKEIILSAGAYNTPQILQLSGLGDKNLLNKFNIPVILDNANIGSNL